MTPEILFFFRDHMDAVPLYEAFETAVLALGEDIIIKVQKTQITFAARRGFAFVSFLPVRKAKERPRTWLTVSFGLRHRLDSLRIDQASEPYPMRWTHHLLISSPEEVDEELMGWIREAYEFARSKR